MFSRYYTNSVLQQHKLRQRCYISPDVDENLNSESDLGRASILSTKIIVQKTCTQKSFNPGVALVYCSLACLTRESIQ